MNRLVLAGWLTVLGLARDVVERLRGWRRLRLATWNIGNAKQVPTGLRAGARTERLPVDAVGLGEASDQWRDGGMIAKLREQGYRIISGILPGQSATPLAWNPQTLELVRQVRRLAAERQYVGAGAGPSMLKQKWEIGGLFRCRLTGREFWIVVDHWVSSQHKRRRFLVALNMGRGLVALGRAVRRPVFSLGDKNAIPQSKALAPLRAAGWLLSHTVGRALPTHGRRAIDHVWWQPRRWIRFVRQWTEDTQSDHRLLVAVFAIRPFRHPKENR